MLLMGYFPQQFLTPNTFIIHCKQFARNLDVIFDTIPCCQMWWLT